MTNATLTRPAPFMPLLQSSSLVAPTRRAIPMPKRRSLREPSVREKGSKAGDGFEVWHHHVHLDQPSELALMLQFDERR